MNFLEFRRALELFTVFSLADIKKVFTGFDRRRLSEWQNKNYLLKLRRGYYMFADQQFEEKTLFLIANELYAPSYISFESALSYYHLIPESVYGITSATSLKTVRFNTFLGVFWYRTLQPRFMFGYSLLPFRERSVKIAEPEKALADLLYLRHDLRTKDDLAGLRLNREELQAQCDKKKLFSYLKRYNNKLELKGRLLSSTYRL